MNDGIIIDIPINTDYDYDRLASINRANKELIKHVKEEQKNCCHIYGDTKLSLGHKFSINNPNNSRFIRFINLLISSVISDHNYMRVCKHCGKARYFYLEDEANSLENGYDKYLF